MQKVKITRIKGKRKEFREEFITEEVSLKLYLQNRELIILLCSPFDIESLVTGFLFSSGIITKNSDVKYSRLNEADWSVNIELVSFPGKDIFSRVRTCLFSAGKGLGNLDENLTPVSSDLQLSSDAICSLTCRFLNSSANYARTGGVHSAAITDGKEAIIFKDDIGRHNAIDKVIGEMLIREIPFENKALLTSGRISSEIVRKVHQCRIPLIISKSAPMNMAVSLAQKGGITLVKYRDDKSLTIYTHPHRLRI